MTKAFKLNWHLDVPPELQEGTSVGRWTEVSTATEKCLNSGIKYCSAAYNNVFALLVLFWSTLLTDLSLIHFDFTPLHVYYGCMQAQGQ